MQYELLNELLEQGLSTRKIGEIVGLNYSTVRYYVRKYNLQDKMNYKKPIYIDKNMFNKIDTPTKAYIVGFIISNGYIGEKNVEVTINVKDREVLDYIANNVGGTVREYLKDNNKGKFKIARYLIGSKSIVTDFHKFGLRKEDRFLPIVKKDMNRYLLLGVFDASGNIVFGNRKDRNVMWNKVTFTSQYKILERVQNVLINDLSISSKIKPSKNKNFYILEIHNKEDISKFLNYIYQDDSFIILKRKYEKANALRLNWVNSGKTQEPWAKLHNVKGV